METHYSPKPQKNDHKAGYRTAVASGLKEVAESQMVLDTLARGDRVELIPVKDGIKVMKVRRKELK